MPSVSASAASTTTWSRIVIDREARAVRRARRGVGRRRPGRALAAAEHVGAHDEEPVGVDRRARADHARPTSPRDGWPGPAGPAAWLSPVSACSTSTALDASRVERPPRLVRDRHLLEPPTGLEDVRARAEDGQRTGGARGSSPGRHAPVTGIVGPSRRVTRPSRRGTRLRGRRGCRRASRCRRTGARGPGVTPVVACSASVELASASSTRGGSRGCGRRRRWRGG